MTRGDDNNKYGVRLEDTDPARNEKRMHWETDKVKVKNRMLEQRVRINTGAKKIKNKKMTTKQMH